MSICMSHTMHMFVHACAHVCTHVCTHAYIHIFAESLLIFLSYLSCSHRIILVFYILEDNQKILEDMYPYTCLHMCLYACLAYTHAYICAYTHVQPTHMPAPMSIRMSSLHTCLHTCLYACLAYTHACTHVYTHVQPTHMPAHMPIRMPSLHTCLHTCLYACLAYTHACNHVCRHIYISTRSKDRPYVSEFAYIQAMCMLHLRHILGQHLAYFLNTQAAGEGAGLVVELGELCEECLEPSSNDVCGRTRAHASAA